MPSFQERVVSGLGPAIHVSVTASVSVSPPNPHRAGDGGGRGDVAGQRQRPAWMEVI